MGINTEDHLLQYAKDALQAFENRLATYGSYHRERDGAALDAVYARFPELKPLTCAPRT